MTTIFYIPNFFYRILLKKHQFFRFQNFEDSFLEILKYYIEKNTCRLFVTYYAAKNIFFENKFWGVHYAWNDRILFVSI